MTETVVIPRLTGEHLDQWTPGQPGWCPVTKDGQPGKPLIRCNCGKWTGIALHHVHADGTVTNSFFDSSEPYTYTDRDGVQHNAHNPKGCGWHVMLKLADYDQGDFPPHVG